MTPISNRKIPGLIEDDSSTSGSEENSTDINTFDGSAVILPSDNKVSAGNDSVSVPTKPVVNSPAPGTTGVSANGNTTVEKNNVVVEDIPVGSEDDSTKIEEIKSPQISTQINTSAKHTALSTTDYYQYSTLSAKEKIIYISIIDAIKKTQNVVSVKKYFISYDSTLKILQRAIADYPQYFWLSKSTSITYNNATNIAYEIILYYTDGATTDTLNSSLELSNVADRNTISSQIAEFNNNVSKFISTVPTSYSEVEKEKMIHDYVLSTITYDTASASESHSYGDTLPHCFDSYGAMCEGKAVCEGYSKIFQYLCYCVGINASQVTGSSNGGNHMWNCVKINNNWYQLDSTWDDISGDIPYYRYFYMTTAEAQKERSIDSSKLSVPDCTSVTDSFINAFAVIVDSPDSQPRNYQKSADELNVLGNYIIIYLNKQSISNNYLLTYILNNDSVYMKYVRSKGYTYTPKSRYTILGDFIYIPITR